MSAVNGKYTWLNSTLMPEAQAFIPVFDQGYLYGLGVFTTILILNGQPRFWQRHIQRLVANAKQLGLPRLSVDELCLGSREVVAANGITTGRLRITITPQTQLITAQDGLLYKEDHYARGFSCSYARGRRHASGMTSGVKSTAYVENLLTRAEAKAANYDECLFLDMEGRVAEGSATNIFIIRKGVLYTPPIDTGLLPGVARSVLLQHLPSAGYEVQETSFKPIDLANADEAFLTNSLMRIMPLTSIEGTPIGTGKPGLVTAQVSDIFSTRQEAEAGWD